MLKIKDNVALKELKKYGFKRIQYLNYYQKSIFYREKDVYCFSDCLIDTKTRYIKIRANIDFKMCDTIYDLIKADLVEKVE